MSLKIKPDNKLSIDRLAGDEGYGFHGNNRQQNQYSPSHTSGLDQVSRSRQMSVGEGAHDNIATNGSSPAGKADAQNGSEKTQTLPYRDRSRTRANGGANLKTSNSTLRVCKKCGETLTGQFVRALGGTFHLECFKCRVRHCAPCSSDLNDTKSVLGLWSSRGFQILSG